MSVLALSRYRRYPPPAPVKHGSEKGRRVTVGIAVIARRENAIVLMADRALTYGNIQGEGGLAKRLKLGHTEEWQVLLAGSPAICEAVVWRARELIPDHPSANEVRRGLRQAFLEVKGRLSHDLLVRPHRYAPRNDAILEGIHNRLEQFELNCELIVCGFQAGEPILFTVKDFDRGEKDDEQTPIVDSERIAGFAVIGSGGDFALQRLLWNEPPPDEADPLPAVLYRAFDAKAYAEQDIYVSWAFDAWVFTELGGLRQVSRNAIRLLDDAHNFANDLPFVRLPGHNTKEYKRTGHKKPEEFDFEATLEREAKRLLASTPRVRDGQRATGARKPGSSQAKKR